MALAAVGIALALVVRVTVAATPFSGLSAPYVLGAGALGLLALWTLVSAAWSDAPARALVEYDRVLLYLLGFVVLGAAARTPGRLRWLVRGIALAAFAVCLCGLITRLLPDVWAVRPSVATDRLSYPLTYWNALGLLAGIGTVLCFAMTCDAREPAAGRVLGAAALPVLGATLLLTFSRGAIAAAVVGLLAVILAGRPRALLSGLLVAVPTVAVAVMSAYAADLLATERPTTPAATAQGHDVAVVVAACVLAAAAGRTMALLLDRRLERVRLPVGLRRPAVGWAAAVVATAAVVAVVVAAGAPQTVQRQYDRFVAGDRVGGADVRGRLTNPGNNGRLQQWRVAVNAFQGHRLRGRGAGTYALAWDRERPEAYQVEDAHSLYVEVLGELGLVGLLLTAAAVLAVLAGFLARARGADRTFGAALFGAGLAWALHAGIDWDWEMPAVTFWFFAAGGAALAASSPLAGPDEPDAPQRPLGRPVRLAVGAGCLVLALLPARLYLSEGPLRDSARAFARGDCATAVDRALDSSAALGVRSEPYVLVGYCDVRLGRPDLGVRSLQNAVRRDPANWETHYGLALVRAAAGLDPRPAARAARRLNPLGELPAEAVRRFATDDRRTWRRRALRARLPVE